MKENIILAAKAALALASLLVASLLAYDVVAVQPRLGEVRSLLERAPPLDANPPALVRRMIDANADSPSGHATRLVVSHLYPDAGMARWHVRNALWRLLLPLHLGETGMYGLYATLSFNGIDHGLSQYAHRTFAKPLDQLSPAQAATTVAITHLPVVYARDGQRLQHRADALLAASALMP